MENKHKLQNRNPHAVPKRRQNGGLKLMARTVQATQNHLKKIISILCYHTHLQKMDIQKKSRIDPLQTSPEVPSLDRHHLL